MLEPFYPSDDVCRKWLRRAHILAEQADDSGTDSMVYFLAPLGGGNIKIGVTASPRTRFKTIQNNSPLSLDLIACAPGGKEIESLLHSIFMRERLHGEWFHPSPRLTAAAESFCEKWIG